eukprot:XP_011671338.1 PREDICTED: G-patch and R3H domain-containing protein C30B4.02c [Strongylocentrotus purpuratus]
MTVILEGGSDGDSDLEIDAGQYTKESSRHRKRRSKDGRSEEEEEEVDEEEDDYDGIVNQQLLLSIEDVKTLRRSLEANPHIRRSICRKGTESDDGSSSSEDDIEEEDEDEIEEDLDVLDDSLDVGRRDSGEKMKIEPGDMIVLDFASHMKRKEDAERQFICLQEQAKKDSGNGSLKKQKDVVIECS